MKYKGNWGAKCRGVVEIIMGPAHGTLDLHPVLMRYDKKMVPDDLILSPS